MIGAGIEDVNHELVGGIYSQLIFGESFEEQAGGDGVSGSGSGPTRATWSALTSPPSAGCTYRTVVGDASTGLQSQSVSASPGAPAWWECGVVNRGLDSAGLYFAPHTVYDGSLSAKLVGPRASAAHLSIALIDTRTNATLASTIVVVPPGDVWVRYRFSLATVDAGSACTTNDASPRVPCAPNAESLCPGCSGAITFALGDTNVSILLDQVYLAAHDAVYGGAPIRPDVAVLLTQPTAGGGPRGMGLNAMRLGGSAIQMDGYKWKAFRGDASARQPYTGWWYPHSSSGWGFFEFLALCEAAPGLSTCVVTMNSGETGGDVADFLEYCYGDAAGSSVWAQQRAADGHPLPYRPFWIEIGNEQVGVGGGVMDVSVCR